MLNTKLLQSSFRNSSSLREFKDICLRNALQFLQTNSVAINISPSLKSQGVHINSKLFKQI